MTATINGIIKFFPPPKISYLELQATGAGSCVKFKNDVALSITLPDWYMCIVN